MRDHEDKARSRPAKIPRVGTDDSRALPLAFAHLDGQDAFTAFSQNAGSFMLSGPLVAMRSWSRSSCGRYVAMEKFSIVHGIRFKYHASAPMAANA
jgi:hypothetical protein